MSHTTNERTSDDMADELQQMIDNLVEVKLAESFDDEDYEIIGD